MRDRDETFAVLRSEDGIDVVLLRGEIDHHEGMPLLDRTLAGLKGRPGAKILLDFRDVTYCCSSGIALILDTANIVGSQGGVLVCAAVSGAAREPMDLLDIPDVIPFYDSVLEALEALEQGTVEAKPFA
jgi:anti-anti-sigma factor